MLNSVPNTGSLFYSKNIVCRFPLLLRSVNKLLSGLHQCKSTVKWQTEFGLYSNAICTVCRVFIITLDRKIFHSATASQLRPKCMQKHVSVFVYTVLCLFRFLDKTWECRHTLVHLSKCMLNNNNPVTCFICWHADSHSIMGTFLQPRHIL
jgi:hypothetical protein